MNGKLIVIGSLVATLTACASQSSYVAAPQAIDTAASDVDTSQMRTYTQPGGAVKFDYPKDWQDATDYFAGGSPGSKRSLFKDGHGARCRVTVQSVAKNADHPDNESVLHLVTGFPKESDVIKELCLKIDGNEIYERVYKYQQFKTALCPIEAVFNFVILKDEEAYRLTLECRFQDYETYLPMFERMGKSFRVYPVKKSN